METYENSFFRPKPRDKKPCDSQDCPCLLNAFACTEEWWEKHIKTFIDMCSNEYGKEVTIDTDDLELKHTVDVCLDGKYVMTAKSAKETASIIKTIYSMLTLTQQKTTD